MWKLTKDYFKSLWVKLWSKTTVDEKAIGAYEEVVKRYKLTTEELKDIAKAVKEVGNQIDDLPNAFKGKPRKGRKNGQNK